MKSHSGNLADDIGDLARTYAVVREIGRGGMGAVVLARHREARHQVAIKIASTDKLDAETLARFSREAYLMARFRHPNIVSLYTVEPIGQGRVGIVMEYVRGQSLARLLSSGKLLPVESCTRIVRDLGKALAHAHAHGVVHRDVKPQNVLIEDGTDCAKLADFGIAKVTGDTADVTATGAALGTPAYMSPEQIDGAPLDGRSDIYSLGVLAWEMVTGQRPWAGEPLFKLLYKQKHEPFPPVTLFRPDTPIGLQLAIEGALAKDPAARWSSVTDMIAQLDETHPIPALLARREREASVLRARGAGAPNDAATLPVQRNAPIAPTATPRATPADGETTIAVAESTGANADAPGHKSSPGRARAFQPSFAHSSWRRHLPFIGGLLFGGVAVLAVLTLRAKTPAGAEVIALPLARDNPPTASSPAPAVASPSAPPRTTLAEADTPPASSTVAPAPVAEVASPPVAAPAPASATGSGLASSTLDNRAAAYALANRARTLAYTGERSRVAALVDSALSLDPRSGTSYAVRARLRIASGNVRDAWTDVEMSARTGARWESLVLSTMLWARDIGPRAAGRRLADDVRAALTAGRTLDAERAAGLATALTLAGDTATALTILERANPSDTRLPALLRDPYLAPLHRSARFQQLAAPAVR